MNTWVKTGVTATAMCAALVLAACSPKSTGSDAEVQGQVVAKTSDIECKSAFGLMAFDAGSGGSSGRSSSKSSSKPAKKAPSAPKAPATTKPKSSAPKSTKPKSAKPKKGCSPDWELVVQNKDGSFEQDVTEDTWNACTEGEQFPACANEGN